MLGRPGRTVLLLPLLCCGPVDPGDTAGGSSGTATTSNTTGTTAAPGTSSSTSTDPDPTDGGSGTATSGTSTTTTTSTSTGTTTAGSTTVMTTEISGLSDPGTTADTGGPVACGVADADYGDCATPLGWAFDGAECRPVSGCDCGPDCDKFFPGAAECALSCAAAGHCNEERLDGAALAQEPVMQGQLCDEIDVCPESPDLKAIFEQIFGMLTCEGGGFCDGNGEKCTGIFQNMLGPDEWLKTCAASLVQGGGNVICVVFGP